MKVMVTGGSGAVGLHVVRQLLGAGHEVLVFDQYRSPLLPGEAAFSPGSILDVVSLITAVKEHGIRRVIHLAALHSDWHDRFPYSACQADVTGTLNVLEMGRLAEVERIVMTSSWVVYKPVHGTPHDHPQYAPVPETWDIEPSQPYGVWKWSGERLGFIYASSHGFEFSATRFSVYYSPEKALLPRRGTMGDIITNMMCNALDGKPTRVPQGGEQRFDLVYVKDCAKGLIQAVLSDRPGNVFNIAAGTGIRLEDFAHAVRECIPSAAIEIGPGLNPTGSKHGKYLVLDTTRAAATLGFRPDFDLSKGVADCLDEIRSLRSLRR